MPFEGAWRVGGCQRGGCCREWQSDHARLERRCPWGHVEEEALCISPACLPANTHTHTHRLTRPAAEAGGRGNCAVGHCPTSLLPAPCPPLPPPNLPARSHSCFAPPCRGGGGADHAARHWTQGGRLHLPLQPGQARSHPGCVRQGQGSRCATRGLDRRFCCVELGSSDCSSSSPCTPRHAPLASARAVFTAGCIYVGRAEGDQGWAQKGAATIAGAKGHGNQSGCNQAWCVGCWYRRARAHEGGRPSIKSEGGRAGL